MESFKNQLLISLGTDTINVEFEVLDNNTLQVTAPSPNSDEAGCVAVYHVTVSNTKITLKTVKWESKLLPMVQEFRPIDKAEEIFKTIKAINKASNLDDLTQWVKENNKKDALMLKCLHHQSRQAVTVN